MSQAITQDTLLNDIERLNARINILERAIGTGSITDNSIPWTPLPLNTINWTSYDGGASFYIPEYSKDANGFVHFRGLAKSVVGYGYSTPSSIIGTLPEECRPLKQVVNFTFQTDSQPLISLNRTDITPLGQIQIISAAQTGASNNGVALYLSMYIMTPFQAQI